MSQESPGGTRSAVAASAVTLLWSRFTVAGVALAFVAISTRLLSLREMAVFAVYNSLCATQAMISSLGVFTTCTREIPDMLGRKDFDGASRLMKSSLIINAVLSAALASLMALLARPLSLIFLKDDLHVMELRLAAAAVFLWNTFEASQLLLVASQRFKRYGSSNVVCAIAQKVASLGCFALLLPKGYGLAGYIGGYGAGTIVGCVASYSGLKDLLSRRAGLAPFSPLIKYSAPFYADGYMRYLYMQADQLLIGIFLTPEVLSLYFVAKRFSQYFQQTVASSLDPVLAKVAEIRSWGGGAVERTLRSSSRYFALAFIPFTAAAASMSALFLDLAGGSTYREAEIVLAFLTLSVVVYAAFNLITGYVYMLGTPADRLRHNLVTGLSQAGLMAGLLWMARESSAGALTSAAFIALARTGALAAGLVYAHGQLKRYIRPVYNTSEVPRSVVASILMAATMTVPQLLFYRTWIVPVYGMAGLAVFAVAIRSAVKQEDLEMLDGVLGRRGTPVGRAARWLFGQKEEGSPAAG